ncbi:MAG: deaminase [Marivirga sp.]|nr:deaminase [Marivirga sp.]
MKRKNNLSFGKVVLTITMSLDGFIAGPNANVANPLGDGGIRLHDWIFKHRSDDDTKIQKEWMDKSGAVIVGGTTYHDAIDIAWGGNSPFKVPAFVITRRVPKEPKEGFTFFSDGIEETLKHARTIAGDKNVWVMGGANIIQQFIKFQLFDELHISIAPVFLQEGKRLFEQTGTDKIELENTAAVLTPGAMHLKFSAHR